MELERLSELEGRIRGIVEECSSLKDRNQELQKMLDEKNAQLEEIKDSRRVLNEQKDAVRVKVDMLLDMLKDVEVS